MIRFHGRADATWKSGARTAAGGFATCTPIGEIGELAAAIADIVQQARESHLLMNNCYRDYGVRNAGELRDAIEHTASPGSLV